MADDKKGKTEDKAAPKAKKPAPAPRLELRDGVPCVTFTAEDGQRYAVRLRGRRFPVG